MLKTLMLCLFAVTVGLCACRPHDAPTAPPCPTVTQAQADASPALPVVALYVAPPAELATPTAEPDDATVTLGDHGLRGALVIGAVTSTGRHSSDWPSTVAELRRFTPKSPVLGSRLLTRHLRSTAVWLC